MRKAALVSAVLSAGFQRLPEIPKTWDDAEMSCFELPLATRDYSPRHVPSSYYEALPFVPCTAAIPSITLLTSLPATSTSFGRRSGPTPTSLSARGAAWGTHKVPSLNGLWYRGRLQHEGAVGSLEEWLDPKTFERGVAGHPFGLELSEEQRAASSLF